MSNYWIDRENEHRKKKIKSQKKLGKKIEAMQLNAMDEIQDKIEGFYGRYAEKTGMTIDLAREQVKKLDIERYERKAAKYVRERNFSKRANDEMRLYNLTMKTNRLELLKMELHLEYAAMTDDVQTTIFDEMIKNARAEYKRQSGLLGMDITNEHMNLVKIINSSFNNATWSERLWLNQDILRLEIEKILTNGIVQGINPRQMARDFRKKWDVSIFNSERLFITESARVQADIFEDTMEQAGFSKYKFLAEETACDICSKLDNKVFNKSDMKIGVNMYPMHPFCHCSTSNYIDREAWEKKMRERDKPKGNQNK